jgi:hypothetical protein
MTVTPRYLSGIAKRVLTSTLLVAALGMWGGCLMDPSARGAEETADPAVSDPNAGPKALRDQSEAPSNGVPQGCSLAWSDAARDSVLFCPDIRPPLP